MSQYVYGRNTVLSALKEHKIKKIYVLDNFSFTPILNEIKRQKLECVELKRIELDKMSEGQNHQGVIGIIEEYKYIQLDDLIKRASNSNYPLLIILDGIKDPHNFGAIMRSADAFQANGIIIKKNGQVPLNSTVAKVSTGAIDFVPVAMVNNISQTIKKLKENGYWIVGSDASATIDYTAVDYKCPIALIVGSEGEGISRLVLENCDFITKIAMGGHINSLNASVATAIYLAQIFNNRFPS